MLKKFMMNFGLRKGTKLKGKELTDKLKELNSVDTIVCDENELNEYILYGLLMPNGKSYLTRTGKSISVSLVKPQTFNINLSNIINMCDELSKSEKVNRIFCMTQKTYDKYKAQQLIIQKQDISYYRIFENELWRVLII